MKHKNMFYVQKNIIFCSLKKEPYLLAILIFPILFIFSLQTKFSCNFNNNDNNNNNYYNLKIFKIE